MSVVRFDGAAIIWGGGGNKCVSQQQKRFAEEAVMKNTDSWGASRIINTLLSIKNDRAEEQQSKRSNYVLLVRVNQWNIQLF